MTVNGRLKEILDEIAKPFRSGKYSYDDPDIVAEVRELLGLPTIKQNKLRYVGICGHIGAGKDYVSNCIVKNIERKCVVVKFATKLVEVTASILGVDDLSLFQNRVWKEHKQFVWQCSITTNNATEKLISAREALCTVGSLMRSVDPQIWVRALANSCDDPDTLYIISDLRYQNEFEFVQQNNGIVVFIENLQAAQNQHQKEAGVVHESEKLVWDLHYGHTQPDYVLTNNDYNNKQPLQDLLTFIQGI